MRVINNSFQNNLLKHVQIFEIEKNSLAKRVKRQKYDSMQRKFFLRSWRLYAWSTKIQYTVHISPLHYILYHMNPIHIPLTTLHHLRLVWDI
jgi:hypothetical protein